MRAVRQTPKVIKNVSQNLPVMPLGQTTQSNRGQEEIPCGSSGNCFGLA